MDIVDFIQIAVVGALVSGLLQFLKNYFGATASGAKLLTVGVSLVVGALYYFLVNSPFWESTLAVLSSASVVYGLFLKK